MICAVHAVVGAAIGKLAGKPGTALAGGVASHLIGDLLPHKDFDPKIEAPLLAVTLAFLAWRCGVRSPAFAGALGGVAPDVENAAFVAGLWPMERVRFPTHIEHGRHHGRKIASAWPQAVGAALCLAYVFKACR